MISFALFSHVLPPSSSGQAIVLHRLLSALPPESYYVITTDDLAHRDTPGYVGDASERLPVEEVSLPARHRISGDPASRLRRLVRLGKAWLAIRRRARDVAALLRRKRIRTLVACTAGDFVDLPACWLAARRCGVRFIPYYFDDYFYQWSGYGRSVLAYARSWEPRFIRGSTGIVVPNEFLRDELRARYGVEATVVHNPVEDHFLEERGDAPWPASPPSIRVVYTGAVYAAHFDAFRNLLGALGSPSAAGTKLHIYTAQPLGELEAAGIAGRLEVHGHVPHTEVREVQRGADILFLPLAFNSPYPDIIRTASPGKLGEYLASGRPILAHAPADSFVTWYVKEHRCGLVVDTPEPARIADALERLRRDADLRRDLVARATERAQRDFARPVAAEAFSKLLGAG